MANNNTLIKTFKILDLISKSNVHLTSAEISRELDLPTSTTHDILKTLLDENVIYYKDFKSKTYAIGIRIYALSKSYIYDSNIINVSSEYISTLCEKYGLGGYVLKPIYKNMMITYKYEPNSTIVKIPDVGFEFERMVFEIFDAYYEENVLHEQISSISCPIFDYTNHAIGEIKLIGLKSEVESNKDKISVELIKCAKEISKNLGATKPL